MRILYQHRTLADGAEGIHIAEMVEAFEALGHEVVMHALTSSSQRGEGRPSALGRVKALLPGIVYEMAVLGYNIIDYVGFRAAIRKHRPDLVYKRHALYDAGVIAACRHTRTPVVLEANCVYSSEQNRRFELIRLPWVARYLERMTFLGASLVATVSSPLETLIQELCGGRAHVLVVPNGANPRRFVPREIPRELRARLAPDGAALVGWVGILRPWHRVELLFEAVAGLENVHVAIIGDGPDRERLEGIARSLGIDRRVHFTGRVSHDEMPSYIATLDIAVSADDRTGYASPMKLLEYMAMAKPVVAPRLPNIEDIICDGEDGLLFIPGDAADLRRVVSRLVNDAALRRRCGTHARLKIERQRNWIAIARQILDHTAVDRTDGKRTVHTAASRV